MVCARAMHARALVGPCMLEWAGGCLSLCGIINFCEILYNAHMFLWIKFTHLQVSHDDDKSAISRCVDHDSFWLGNVLHIIDLFICADSWLCIKDLSVSVCASVRVCVRLTLGKWYIMHIFGAWWFTILVLQASGNKCYILVCRVWQFLVGKLSCVINCSFCVDLALL